MIINQFPDELVPNSEKKSIEFGEKYATAMWEKEKGKYLKNKEEFKLNRLYATANHPVDDIRSNIERKFIEKSYLQIDYTSKVTILQDQLNKVRNSVNMKEFTANVSAIDPTARLEKQNRKNEKLKLLYSKDFFQKIQQAGGEIPIPLDDMPESEQQIELEELRKPLDIEKAEELAILGIFKDNMFEETQHRAFNDALVCGIGWCRPYLDPIEGVRLKYVDAENMFHSKSNDRFLRDVVYFGEFDSLTVSDIKKISSRNNIVITDEQIQEWLGDVAYNPDAVINVIRYAFKTFHKDVYKVKKNRKNNKMSIIDRTKDEGTDKAYNPKMDSDISSKVEDVYDVWYQGILIVNEGSYKCIEHKLMENMLEYNGVILTPYVGFAPRIDKNGYNSLVSTVRPNVKQFQEIKWRIQHLRNSIRPNRVKINSSSLSKVKNGDGSYYTPDEVMKFFFTLGIEFEVTEDADGYETMPKTAIRETPNERMYALLDLLPLYDREKQEILEAFGYIGADLSKPDEKSLVENEVYRLSDNQALKDYSDTLFTWSGLVAAYCSSMLDEVFKDSDLKDKYVDMIGIDDVNVINKYRKNRGKHFFDHIIEFLPTRAERLELNQALNYEIQRGTLNMADVFEIKQIKSKKVAFAVMSERIEMRMKESQKYEMDKSNNMQNGNIMATQARAESDMQVAQLEFQLKAQLEDLKHKHRMDELQAQKELEFMRENRDKEFKVALMDREQQTLAQRDNMKKDRDEETRLKAINESKRLEEELARKKGQIKNETTEEVDLKTLLNE